MQPKDNPKGTEPREARRQFLMAKKGNVKKSSWRTYKYPTKHFVEFCEKHGVDTTGDIDSHVIESWKQTRKRELDAQISYRGNTKKLLTFIRWCESAGYVEYPTADRIELPQASKKERRSEETVRLTQAEEMLRYLQKFEYASRKHALFYTLWHTGCRISGAISLDLGDLDRIWDEDEGEYEHVLMFRDRLEQGTPLKNGESGERNVTISQDLYEVLQDYISQRREAVTDEFHRKPLFTTNNQRITRQRAYKDYVALSRPCHINDTCPHDRDIEDCTAARQKKRAFGCPSSKSLHPIRRGSITHHINMGWPKPKLSERVDVSVQVLNDHYDNRRNEEERKGRKQFLDLL